MKIHGINNILFYIIIIIANIQNIALANDGSAEVQNPRPTLIEPIDFSLSSVNIIIALPNDFIMTPKDKNFSVSYDLVRSKGGLVQSTIEFIIPSYSNNGAAWWYPDRSFQDLEIWVNGQKANRGHLSHALFGSRDITPELSAYGLSPNMVAGDSPDTVAGGLPGTTENMQRYAKLIDNKYLWLANFFGDTTRLELIPKWRAANRYWISFESKAGDKINFTYRHCLLPAAYQIHLNVNNDAELACWDLASTLKSLKLTVQDIRKLLGGSEKSSFANISWSNIPISNLALGRQVGSLTVEVKSEYFQPPNMAKRLIFVAIDSDHIYSATGKIKVELKDYRIEQDILIAVFELM
jgi:hypothetical protein